jgi:hypothetical protein
MMCLGVSFLGLAIGCKKQVSPDLAPQQEPRLDRDDDDKDESREEEDRDRDNYWRAQLLIVGQGGVKTAIGAFDCTSNGTKQWGECGPKLVTFKEMMPALLRATPATGWRLDHWESMLRQPDGTTSPRKGPIPDGLLYLNGFGYADTGELDIVKAVFVPVRDP